MLQRVISGGQTGVDRAALDVALELAIPCGGKCPRGRRAEDGRIDPRYPLEETSSEDYAVRTESNVRDSDGTLILLAGPPDRGTSLTIAKAQQHERPCLLLDLEAPDSSVAAVLFWAESNGVEILNVAGPRESSSPGIYDMARTFLRDLFGRWRTRGQCPDAETGSE